VQRDDDAQREDEKNKPHKLIRRFRG